MDLTPEEVARAQAWVNRLYSAALEAELSLVSTTVVPSGEPAAVLVWSMHNGGHVTLAPLGMIPTEVDTLDEHGAITENGMKAFGAILTILRKINDYKPGIGKHENGRTALVITAPGSEPQVLVVLPWDENPMKCWMAPGTGAGETRH